MSRCECCACCQRHCSSPRRCALLVLPPPPSPLPLLCCSKYRLIVWGGGVPWRCDQCCGRAWLGPGPTEEARCRRESTLTHRPPPLQASSSSDSRPAAAAVAACTAAEANARPKLPLRVLPGLADT